ncbi:MAG: hypothetical protein ABI639_12105 [Thermoanaerobaculia bacterium]
MRCALVVAALLTTAPALNAGEPAVSAPGLEAFPANPDPALRYVVYLHGRIVEDQGRKAVSPELGPYQFDEIVAALQTAAGGDGSVVVAELRKKDADASRSATHTAMEIRRLLAGGVAASAITVVGASKGGVIAMLVSTQVENDDVGYAILGGCSEDVVKGMFGGRISLHGRVLSIFEKTDPIGRSCQAILSGSKGLKQSAELELNTRLRHGFLYKPLVEWVAPVEAWIAGRKVPEALP